jgi:hypothetical protein
MRRMLWAQTRFGSFNVDPEPELSQWADREAALAWFALFEAMRLEARLAQELPGLARDIRRPARALAGRIGRRRRRTWRDPPPPRPTACAGLPNSEKSALARRRFFPT